MNGKRLPPGPRGPAFVEGVRFARDPLGSIRTFCERHGPIASARFPGFGLMVYISDPGLVREVFTGDPTRYHAGESTATILEPMVGAGSVLTLDEEPHMRQRKLLLEPFHGENVNRWQDTIRAITEQDMETWPTGEPFSLRVHTQKITLDVILRAVFGVREQARFDRARSLIGDFARRSHPISLFRFARHDLGPLSPWARFKRARAALNEFLYEEIERRRAQPDLGGRDDVLAVLLRAKDEAGQQMRSQEIRDELVTVIVAGHETTATALAWAFERLLRNPPVLDRLTQSLADGDEYLDATIKETLRIRPVITDVGRRLTHDIELSGYRIPAGALVMPAIAAIHFREDLYPQPEEFRPERFLDHAPEPYTWIPFGGGVRRCIGASLAQLEMRVILRGILEHAQLDAPETTAEKPVIRNITIAPKHGTRVVLKQRTDANSPLCRTPVAHTTPSNK